MASKELPSIEEIPAAPARQVRRTLPAAPLLLGAGLLALIVLLALSY